MTPSSKGSGENVWGEFIPKGAELDEKPPMNLGGG